MWRIRRWNLRMMRYTKKLRERHGKSGFQVVPDARSAPYGALSVHLPTSIPKASCAGLADDSWTAPN